MGLEQVCPECRSQCQQQTTQDKLLPLCQRYPAAHQREYHRLGQVAQKAAGEKLSVVDAHGPGEKVGQKIIAYGRKPDDKGLAEGGDGQPLRETLATNTETALQCGLKQEQRRTVGQGKRRDAAQQGE